MALSFDDAQQAVIDYLKASDIPNVFEANVPPGFELPKQNGAHLPYVCVSFGGQGQVPNKDKGIDSSKLDLKRTAVMVECIANSPRDVRRLTNVVRGMLEGYVVDESWSELSETQAGEYTMYTPDYDLWPVRYATGLYFKAYANAVINN